MLSNNTDNIIIENTVEQSSIKVLVLGASGETGRIVSKYILESTPFSLTLVGRNRARLEKLRDFLKEESTATVQPQQQRIELHEIQLEECLKNSDYQPIKNLLQNHQALINTIPPLDNHQHTVMLAELAIEMGVDWIDPHMSPSTARLLKPLNDKAIEHNTTITCQTGMYPGLASPLVREAAKHLPNISRASVAIMSREEGGMDMTSGIKDIVDYMKESGSNVMVDGNWKSDSVMARKFNFPSVGDKTLSCYPLELEEMKGLNIPTLKNMGSYITEMGMLADTIMLGLQMSGKYMSCMVKPLSKLLPWSTGKVKAPFGSAMQVEAFDDEGNSYFLSIFHEHVYYLTAASIVSVLEQMMENRMNKKTNPGVHFAGMYADSSKLIEACKQKGMRIDTQQSSFHQFNTNKKK